MISTPCKRMRGERRERGVCPENPQKVSTLFVDNLPLQIRKIWLYNLFSRFGKIKDVFIPRKRSKITGQSFGFVRFDSFEEAALAIARTNNNWYWDQRLVVKTARFFRKNVDQVFSYQNHDGYTQDCGPRSHGGYQHTRRYPDPQFFQVKDTVKARNQSIYVTNRAHIRGATNQSFQSEKRGKEIWRRKGFPESSRQGEVRNAKTLNEQTQEELNTIVLHPSGNGWLYRSAIGRMKRLVSTQTLADVFKKEDGKIVQIKSIGGRAVIISFSDEKERDIIIQQRWTEQWFDELRPWDGEGAQMERFVWLHCYGMPLNVWNVSTFKEIGNNWGEFMVVDDKTLRQNSYEKARILIVTESEEKIDSQVQLKVNGKKYLVKVKEMETFRVLEPEQLASIFESKVEDDEVDNMKVDGDGRLDKENNLVNDMEIQRKLDDDKDGDEAAIMEGGVGMESGNDRLLKRAVVNIEEGRHQAINEQVKAADQHSFAPIQRKSKDIEADEAFIEVNSNSSHGLESLVEDSGGPIKETYLNILTQLQRTQKFEAQSKERLEYVVQQKVGKENRLENEDHLKDLERNIMSMDGLVVLGSSNNIRASQIPSINLQVELNPREAKKELRKRISQSCDSADNTSGVSGLQGFQQNTVLQELYANTIVGDKLGIEYTDNDIRLLKKQIEIETSNRFAPLQRSNSKH